MFFLPLITSSARTPKLKTSTLSGKRQMNQLKTFVVVVCFFAAVQAQSSCDPSKGLGFNPDCGDISTPYCRQTSNTPATYSCVECNSHCDCSLGEYCSSNSSTVGTCTSFSSNTVCANSADGCSCRPLSGSQILDSTFPDSWKCAVIATSVLTNQQVIDVLGVCNSGSCEICDSRASLSPVGRLPNCGAEDGTYGTKSCTVGGSFVQTHFLNWAPSLYYENPIEVWLAIYFPFIVLIIVVQFLTCQRANL